MKFDKFVLCQNLYLCKYANILNVISHEYQRFGLDVCNLVLGVPLLQMNDLVLDQLLNIMLMNLNVLGPRMVRWMASKPNGILIITL